MQKLLIRLFVKNPGDVHLSVVRQQYGRLSSLTGIILNLFLFAAKFTVGTLFHSISVTSDAVNNLSDAGSSVISLASFKMAGKPADKDHPFGHARIEYIASSVAAVLILFIGVELFRSSINKIIHPDAILFSWLTVGVLVLSIAIKIWLYTFNHSLGKRLDSSMMQATATDSLSDVLATTAVLVSMFLSPLIHFQLDGYMGVVVSLFIMTSGLRIMKETMDRILGQGPTVEMAQMTDDYIRKYDGVLNTHDLMVHDYGPHHIYASVHAEVDAGVDILISHDLIDNIERDIKQTHNINLVIHLDPVVRNDPLTNRMSELVSQVITGIDASLTYHDFRMVKGQTHSNLIFDLLVPFEFKMKNQALITTIQDQLSAYDPKLRVVVTIDRKYF